MLVVAKKSRIGVGGRPRAQRVAPVKPKRVKIDREYRMRYGTAGQLSDVRHFRTEKELRDEIIKNLRTVHEPWCARYNHAGVDVIKEAIIALGGMAIHVERQRLEVRIDEHYDLTVVYEFWKENM